MRNLLNLALIIGICLSACSKKSTPKPTPTDVIEYDFKANESGSQYEVNYYDGVSLGSAQNVYSNTWSTKVNIPIGTNTASIFFTGGQNPPYTGTNKGSVTIKLNGKVVATDTASFTSTSTLAEATYQYNAN